MTSADVVSPVLLALLTKPAQPLMNAAEELRITAPTAHTNPLAVVFIVAGSSRLKSAYRPGTGVGSAEAEIATLWP